MRFCDNLKIIRTERKIKQKELADALGWSQARISSYEAGAREPSTQDIQTLADYFGVPYAALVTMPDGPDNERIIKMIFAVGHNEKLAELFDLAVAMRDDELAALLMVAHTIKRKPE